MLTIISEPIQQRQNKTMKTMIAMYAKDNHHAWDAELHQVSCVLRISQHEIITVSPSLFLAGICVCLVKIIVMRT